MSSRRHLFLKHLKLDRFGAKQDSRKAYLFLHRHATMAVRDLWGDDPNHLLFTRNEAVVD